MYLGIDTSCYTTSLAVLDDRGRLIFDGRKMLDVPPGGRGLRQSDGVFAHLRNLPVLAERAGEALGGGRLAAVAASGRPRPVSGSYMPVFTAGESFARGMAAAAGVPFFSLSHQEGHLLAGLWSAGVDWSDFLALHVSGGTTELLAASLAEKPPVRELGGSADLQAGQFIDRVGVALGLPFPAGPHLERLAREAGEEALPVPVAVTGTSLSFSGPESFVQRAVAAGGHSPAAVARGVERAVAEALLRLVKNAGKGDKRTVPVSPVLFVGGVMANSYIREYLAAGLGERAVFAAPRFAGDNAVGVALHALRATRNPELRTEFYCLKKEIEGIL
jgi:N6-L-threonylcarbamoyladenine synthase